jgi:hypothetical protein
MVSVSNRRKIIMIFTGTLILLMLAGFGYVLSHGVVKESIADIPKPVATPGLVVYGYVQDMNGAGLEGVSIYRKYASYPGVVIATTDPNGYYQSDFYTIPGDEMVTVWADGLGLKYEPDQYYWRHYYGYEGRECSFIAPSTWKNYFPITTR